MSEFERQTLMLMCKMLEGQSLMLMKLTAGEDADRLIVNFTVSLSEMIETVTNAVASDPDWSHPEQPDSEA